MPVVLPNDMTTRSSASRELRHAALHGAVGHDLWRYAMPHGAARNASWRTSYTTNSGLALKPVNVCSVPPGRATWGAAQVIEALRDKMWVTAAPSGGGSARRHAVVQIDAGLELLSDKGDGGKARRTCWARRGSRRSNRHRDCRDTSQRRSRFRCCGQQSGDLLDTARNRS